MFNMSNKRFIGRSILAVFFSLIGLASCGEKIPTNEIHYTTVDNRVLPLEKDIEDGCPFLSNSYNPEKNVYILKFDKDVTEIGDYTFDGCSSLTGISIPSSVTRIGEYAFRGCSSLTNITIPSSVTEIGKGAFAGCSSLTSISIPSSVTRIGEDAFYGCSSLTNISIPSSVTEIRDYAFAGCSSLMEVRIPKGCQVSYDAFTDCPEGLVITRY